MVQGEHAELKGVGARSGRPCAGRPRRDPGEGEKRLGKPELREPADARAQSTETAERGSGVEPAGALVRVDEEVLADLRHAAGNHFHKLYYWAERLESEDELLRAADLDLGQTLSETVRSLEAVVKGTLEYVRPVQLVRVRMSGAELIRAVEALLRAAIPEGQVETSVGEGVDEASLLVDPARLSAALRPAMAQIRPEVTGAQGTSLGIESRLHGAQAACAAALEVQIGVLAGMGAASGSRDERRLAWAMASRVIEAHGGRLERHGDDEGRPGCTLTLPVSEADGSGRS